MDSAKNRKQSECKLKVYLNLFLFLNVKVAENNFPRIFPKENEHLLIQDIIP